MRCVYTRKMDGRNDEMARKRMMAKIYVFVNMLSPVAVAVASKTSKMNKRELRDVITI